MSRSKPAATTSPSAPPAARRSRTPASTWCFGKSRTGGGGRPRTSSTRICPRRSRAGTSIAPHILFAEREMKKYLGIFKQTISEFSGDKVPRLGAALAYYTIFSLAPLLLIAIAIAGIVFGHDAAQNKIFEQLRGVLGATTAAGVQEMVKNAAKPKTGTIATVLGVVTLLLGASGVFGQLKDALNTIWDVKPKEARGIMGMIKDRFLSFAMVFGLGFLLLVSLVIDTVIAAMGKYAGSPLPGGGRLCNSGSWPSRSS